MERAHPDIKFENCNAACCRAGMNMSLSRSEVFFMGFKIRRKMNLAAADHDRTVRYEPTEALPEGAYGELPAGFDIGKLQTDCGYLTEDNQCSVYDNPGRPQACQTFEPGSEACLYSRQQAGFED